MKLRLIIPLWGDKYIDRFNENCLPALLAPGNLPHLAENFECELTIVTHTKFFHKIESLESIQLAKKYANLLLIALDDFISHPAYYGLTITHAFYRGFTDLGMSAKDIWCVFINADFILANDSYRSLVKKMLQGEQCILAPSYCTIEEDVEPFLKQHLIDGNGTISMPHREMANLILQNMHFSIRAKIINSKMYKIDRTDQFYYLHDKDTLIGRQLPIAIMAFRPEYIPANPLTFWDYGAISEICPNANLCVLGDSDDFLMLELRGRESMQEQFKLGHMDQNEIARDLSAWTTKDQRDCGEFTLMLHSGNLPADIKNGIEELNTYYSETMNKARPSPQDHRNHYIWKRTQYLHAEWLSTQVKQRVEEKYINNSKNISLPPKTLTNTDAFAALLKSVVEHPIKWARNLFSQRVSNLFQFAYLQIFGRFPAIKQLHPRRFDLSAANSHLKTIKNPHAARLLAVSSGHFSPIISNIDYFFDGEVTKFSIKQLSQEDQFPSSKNYDFSIIEMNLRELSHFNKLYLHLRQKIKTGGEVFVFCQLRNGERLIERDFGLIANGFPSKDISIIEINGSWPSYKAQRYWEKAIKKLESGRWTEYIFIPIIGLAIIFFSTIAVLAGNQNISKYKINCTSLILRIKIF